MMEAVLRPPEREEGHDKAPDEKKVRPYIAGAKLEKNH